MILITTPAAALGVTLALKNLRKNQTTATPRLGIVAAFLFAAQMVNFPVLGGTSGHLIGGFLASVLLGPAGAIVTMTSILIVQCLAFADGGITALPANILNMAIVAPLTGYAMFQSFLSLGQPLNKFLRISSRQVFLAAAFAGAFTSVIAATLICCAELAGAGTVPWAQAAPLMLFVHALIGLGEAMITVLILQVLVRQHDLQIANNLQAAPAASIQWRWLPWAALTGVTVLATPWASSWPDGLEWSAQTLNFHLHSRPWFEIHSIFSDYQVAGLENNLLATWFSALVGMAILWLAFWVFASLGSLATALISRRRALAKVRE